jgi:hypothetical protein
MFYFYFPLRMGLRLALVFQILLLFLSPGKAQEEKRQKRLEIYGQQMTDIGYNFHQIDPNWFDVLRVTKLPRYEDQFGPDGKIFFSVRQTRLGFLSWSETPWGQIKTTFEFDLFGSGPDVGQTTFHFRKAYVEIGKFTIGQTESPFTDTDVSPNILDFGAPSSRAQLRTVLIRYMHSTESTRWAIALEKPGVTSDEGVYADRIEVQNVKAEFKLPDLSAEYRRCMNSGYIELAGALKWIKWEDTGNGPLDLSGDAIGWGFNISSTQKLNSKTLFKGQFVYGKGIENHLTDADFDIGLKKNFLDPVTPVLGVSLPVIGGLAFLEHIWNSKLSSTIGFSKLRIYNSDAQTAYAFKNGSYAIFNLLCMPFSNFLVGAELQWGKRKNFLYAVNSSAVKIQFSFKYNFSQPFYEQINH